MKEKLLAMGFALVAVWGGGILAAETNTWTGEATDDNWTSAANWSDGSLVQTGTQSTGNIAKFALSGEMSPVVDQNVGIYKILVEEGAGQLTIGGTSRLTIRRCSQSDVSLINKSANMAQIDCEVRFNNGQTSAYIGPGFAFNNYVGDDKQVYFRNSGQVGSSLTTTEINGTGNFPKGIDIESSHTVTVGENGVMTVGTALTRRGSLVVNGTLRLDMSAGVFSPEAYTIGAMGRVVVVPATTETIAKAEVKSEAVEVTDAAAYVGAGGVRFEGGLTVASGGVLVVDPLHVPLYANGTPAIEGKIALAENVAFGTCGRMVLLTYTPAEGDDTSLSPTVIAPCAKCSVEIETAPNGTDKQIVLYAGDFKTEPKATVKIMPLGDSITQGSSSAPFPKANYRIPLYTKLEAAGYAVESCGWTEEHCVDGAAVTNRTAWALHSGWSGQRLCIGPTGTSASSLGSQYGALREQIEAVLDAAGEPDIVTMMIGTNDLWLDDRDEEVYFYSLTNVLHRIFDYRPATHIILSTILPPKPSANLSWAEKVTAFNARIRSLVADGNDFGFPEGQLFVMDGNAVFTEANATDESCYYDSVHPGWKGHHLFSDAWFAAVTNVVAQPFTPTATRTVNTARTAANNVPEAYRKGFTHYYTYTGKAGRGVKDLTDIYSYTNLTADVTKPLARVGYYFEMKRKGDDHVRWVWVDMDGYGKKGAAEVGIPTTYTERRKVGKLRVVSNDPAVKTVSEADGWIVFSQYNTKNEADASLADAPSASTTSSGSPVFDWNDTLDEATAYGVMQVYRVLDEAEAANRSIAAETIFSFNRWGTRVSQSQSNNEFGIGNFAQHKVGDKKSINYIGANKIPTMSDTNFELFNLEIWGKPEASGLVFILQ